MVNLQVWLTISAAFLIICLASHRIGLHFVYLKLPTISGFLFTGIIAGPYVLNIIPISAIQHLRFIDELSLAFIAFAAGGELFIRQLKNRLKSIRHTTIGLVTSTFFLGSLSFFYLSKFLPFTQHMPPFHRAAVAIMAGAILVARSPSSAIAVVNELRAKGPFTKTVLGVTVIMDVVVITIFSICSSISGTILYGDRFDFHFLLLLFTELFFSLILAFILSKGLQIILSLQIHRNLKTIFILMSGYFVFIFSATIRHVTHTYLHSEILLEPMLICMLASFLTINFTQYRTELMKVLHDIAPFIYVAFFTLTGASLMLDVLVYTWSIALMLFLIRIIAIFIGAFCGGILAKDPMQYNRIAWMGYITQAGVGLGLAKQVAVEFLQWGTTFATLMIAVIVLNQIIGPPFFKWALHLVKEVHPRADHQGGDTIRDAVIFGLESDSLALARSLKSNGWEVRLASKEENYIEQKGDEAELEIYAITDISVHSLNRLGVRQANAIVAMLTDEENYQICELVYENFGTRNVIVRLNQRTLFKRFHEIGALVVEPSTAVVNLLDQFVRSPSAATLLLGMEKGREIIEFELRNGEYSGIPIRDLHLPLDIHILSIRRQGQFVICGGFTPLHIGDWLTVVGSRPSLEQMMLQFGENREHALVNLVEQATSQKIAFRSLENDVKKIIHKEDNHKAIIFDRLIEQCIVLDFKATLDYESLFNIVAATLSKKVNIPAEGLFAALMEREKESSTALRPDLAIPHIIIDGSHAFCILLARCRKGIYFSQLAPKVHAVFVLMGTRSERDFHLYALSTIAKIVQRNHFREDWLQANNESALRNIARI
ncbi:MAG: PTS sugar transporter subunit IIA [Desulfobacteraceae bacterium]